ncbi:hypothetical protein EDC96DRAFT_553813 [Choanephora cucurbitarum]|nr:hypothetical protein EDC96DRAFT_553813 [Choanephora cucurbitarum]
MCKAHVNMNESRLPTYVYSGYDLIPEAQALNYRERCVLSQLKLMTQITRNSTLLNGRIGHYEVSGAVSLKHNYELAEMAYNGTLNLFYQRGDLANIRKQRVIAAYSALQQTHPLLARYQLQPLMYSLVNYHIEENARYIDTVHPQASEPNFQDLYIAQDMTGTNIRVSHPSLIALLFSILLS